MGQPLTLVFAVYVIFCVLVGLCGSQRRMGFTGTFLLSLLLTPILMMIILLITGPSHHLGRRLRKSK